MSTLKKRLAPLFCMQGICECESIEYGLLTNEQLSETVRDHVYEGGEEDE